MNRTEHDKLRLGVRWGALGGLFLFFFFGLIPGFYFGSYTTLVILTRLSGVPVEPTPLVRVIIIIGSALGILSMASLFVVVGSLTGLVITRLYLFLKVLRPVEPKVLKRDITLTEREREEILNRLSFLEPRLSDIHSIVLVGSRIYGLSEDNSDTDVVVICKEGRCDEVRELIFGHEIDKRLRGEKDDMEFTIIGPKYTESLFRMGSPFSHSLRYGLVLRDDGYLRGLLQEKHPATPTRQYLLKVIYEYISVQYYGSITEIERGIRKRHCSTQCCEQRPEGCDGLPSADAFRRTLLRMLYATVPRRGYIPLCKRDLLECVRILYGERAFRVVQEHIRAMKQDSKPLYYNEYMEAKPFYTSLFREVITLAGPDRAVTSVLKDAVRMVRGDYEGIQDRAFRECVI